MKIRIYRKNIWLKFDFWQSLFFYALGPAYYLYAIMQYGTANIFGVLFSFLLATYILLASGRFWYYVIFTENELVLKNALYRCTKHFPFKEIEKIQLFDDASIYRGIYFRMFTTSNKPKRYFLECVREKDFYEIVKDLQERGIYVETKHRTEKYLKKSIK